MNRDNYIKIRVSADEMSAIKKRAADSDITVSNFLRDMTQNGNVILYDTENIYRFNQLMRSIGTNINQIALVINAEKKVYKSDIDALRREVNNLRDEFQSYISSLKRCEL